MALDWSKVSKLKTPIQTTANDVILSGHGKLTTAATTVVPPGVILYILAPPGAAIEDETGQALENMTKISMLGLKNADSDVLVNCTYVTYNEGDKAPDYTLQAPVDIVQKPGGPSMISVAVDTPLSQLWARVAPYIKKGKTINCYWAACTALRGATNPVVLFQ